MAETPEVTDDTWESAVLKSETPVLVDRNQLSGTQAGPVIIEEYDATCVVPPGTTAAVDANGNIVITL